MPTTLPSRAEGAGDLSSRCIRWVVALFIAFVLLQRISVPGMTNVSILLPLALLWGAAALARGVAEFDSMRLSLWIAAAAATALVTPLQALLDKNPIISMTSWALLLVQFMPATLRMTDRHPDTYLRLLAAVSRVCSWLAILSLVFMASQLVVPYTDWMETLLPRSVLLDGFNTSYPIQYGSPIYKSNAWVCLEASFLSYIMAVGILAALASRQPMWRMLLLFAGLFSSASGSGFAIIVIGVIVMVLTNQGESLKRFALPAAGVLAAALATPFGRSVLGRVTEVQNSRSSGAVRTVQPYIEMWPQWTSDHAALVLGRGAGSSQRLISGTGIHGLLNPTFMKIFFDYGLIAGAVLFMFVWCLYTGSSNQTLAVAVGFSMWTLQTANVPFVVCVLCVITLWSPWQLRPFTGRLRGPSARVGPDPLQDVFVTNR